MFKQLTSNKGFTLVEVIVVAVIVLILAAVAIPLYNGYMRDSRRSVAESTANSIASAIRAQIQSRALSNSDAAGMAFGTAVSGWTIAAPAADGTSGRTVVTIPHVTAGETSSIVVPAGYTATMTGGCVTVTYGTGDSQVVGRSPVASGVANCNTAMDATGGGS